MSRWIDADAVIDRLDTDEYGMRLPKAVVGLTKVLLDDAPSIDIVRCGECRKVREDGGHANCNGYLYCRKWKTLVDEDGCCSWGEREGE